jgi:RNA polymerase-binding protein DksA
MKKKRLTKKELKEFKNVLIDMKEKIMDEVKHLTKDSSEKSQKDASGELSSYTFHIADMASDSFEREFTMNLASNEQKLLYLIDEALDRIKSGEYGTCEVCEKPIRKKRLRAIPYAKYCLKCQAEQEKRKEGPFS